MSFSRQVAVVACASVALVSVALPARADQPDGPAGTTSLVSATPEGGRGGRLSTDPHLSADGRYVVFLSYAGDLVPDDTNDVQDVFVRDLATGVTVRASVSESGEQANGRSISPSISADGRWVAFATLADNLGPRDRNERWDAYLRDMTTGEVRRVSDDFAGGDANGDTTEIVVSAGGSTVAFTSGATDLLAVPSRSGGGVFLRDVATWAASRGSVRADGAPLGGQSPDLSADGTRLGFEVSYDVVVRDLTSGTVAVVAADVEGYVSIFDWDLAANGGAVVFQSSAAVTADDLNDYDDIFVEDLETGAIELVSLGTDGAQAGDYSSRPAISADGRFVVFDTASEALDRSDENPSSDVLLRDRLAGTTTVISVSSNDRPSLGSSFDASIDDSGSRIVFLSTGIALTAFTVTPNRSTDVYVRVTAARPPSCADGHDQRGAISGTVADQVEPSTRTAGPYAHDMGCSLADVEEQWP
ncbi:MAG: hypothetical protein ACT452_03690 [Microthrixaceae bacterium]